LTKKVQRLINTGSSGVKPKIIQTLEDRFEQASKQLEQVNTGALIDQIYSQEKIKGFTCEKIDYLCRILPNLLLAFGLLGTFLGITINLAALSQTINQSNANDVSNLVNELKKPLEGMSIAFSTSLIGIALSSVLTIFNSIWNTNFAKYQLISSLEDYLDNIYLPQVQGDTRLDKIVNRMVSQQDEFLTNFGETVRKAVEQSMGKVAKQIADGNKETTDLARQVYEKFTDAAGTISSAANEFRSSMSELNITSQIFKQSAETFNQSEFPLKLSLATVDLSNTQQKFSESATSLAATTELIINALIEIEKCSQTLINLGEEINNTNRTSIQVLNLHHNNQNILTEIIPQLQQGANSYEKAVNKLDDLDQRVSDKVNSFDKLITTIDQLLKTVKTYTNDVNTTISIASNQIDTNNQKLMKLLENNNYQLISEYQNVSNTIIQGIDRQTDINKKGFEANIKGLELLIIKNLEEYQQKFDDTNTDT
jgi:Sec-independent protein translocase protein TatA